MLEIDIQKRLGQLEIKAKINASTGITAIFGRSGAGKSSIINMVAGLLRPDQGRIKIDGVTLFDHRCEIDLPAHKRGIGYVFQDARLFPHQSVGQNIAYGRRFRREPDGIDPTDIIDLLGLGPLLDRKPQNLSGGERQRVAIARAIAARPKLILMDEPLASLDGRRRGEILPYIERLRDLFTLPILYVSHSIDEVARLSDTLILLDDGQTVAAGAPSNLLTRLDLRPITGRYQAGASIDATIDGHDQARGLTNLNFAGGRLIAPAIDRAVGHKVKLRILARDVAISLNPIDGISIQNQLPATIAWINIEDGAFAELGLAVGPDQILCRITAASARHLDLKPGHPVTALIKSVAIEARPVG